MNLVWILGTALFATHITYLLSHKTQMGAIRASALPTVLFAALSALIFPAALAALTQPVFFGGSFVGMSESARLCERKVLVSSAVFALIFYFFISYSRGLGGALGAAAFLSCLLVYGARKALGRVKR
ncbi:hypothetical protein [Bdellovibrio bacteriovorus]|uniref:hypothetical protein n=1 Tax=Bdellovibrio TaxID=958 RepID=UPI0035A87A29